MEPIESKTSPPDQEESPPPVPSTLSMLLSPSSSLATELSSGDVNRPIRVILVVYDLLPPGKLSNLAWHLGVGLYHSAVRIPEIGREIAFGGHPHPQLSGIFSLPIRADGKPPMPGLRWMASVDMGEIMTKPIPRTSTFPLSLSRQSHSSSLRNDEERRLIKLSNSVRSTNLPNKALPRPSFCSSSPTIYPPKKSEEMRDSTIRDDESSTSSLASSVSEAPTVPVRTQLETLRHILTQLDECPEWRGTAYDLLRRNCNTFSDELCMLLTGRRTPGWINRAAAVGSALPCLVPNEWAEPPTLEAALPSPSTPQSYPPPRQEMRV